jgi:hypothetical protein
MIATAPHLPARLGGIRVLFVLTSNVARAMSPSIAFAAFGSWEGPSLLD